MTTPTSPAPQIMDIAGLVNEAESHRVAGRARQAEMLCQRVLAVWPGQPEALHVLGLLALSHGKLDLAIQYLRQACRSPGAPANYFSNLAEMYRQKGMLAEGEEEARRSLAINSKNAGAWNNLGIILQQSGKLEESRAALQRALDMQPNNAEVHNNLANTCKQLGLPVVAQEHWTRALALRPDYPEALSNMVVLFTEQGNYALAEDYGLRALRANPRLADAYVNLAVLASTCHNHEVALQLLDTLLQLSPESAEGWAARALALRHLDRLDEALASARRAIVLRPREAEPYHALGVVLQAMGSVADAMEAFEESAALAGDLAEKARVSQSRLLMENGRSEEAITVLRAALQRWPRSAAAWNTFADLHKFKPSDPEIAAMESLISEGLLTTKTQEMLLHFSLGKAYLDTGDSDLAFRHLNQGNRMKRETITYDVAANRAWMGSIAQTFDGALLKRSARGGAKSKLPIFVLGMPRSGTSLVEQILASHSEIYGAGELKFLHRIATSRGEYPGAVKTLDGPTLKAMGEEYLAQVVPLAQGRRYVIDKMPSNFLYVGLIRLILPEARIIHCRRDPVDTCLSCYSKIFADEQSFTYDQAELGLFHRAYQDLMAYWRRIAPKSRLIEVDYEAMVDDTEGQARRLLEFLELPWEASCLEFYRTERPVRTASVNQVRQPVYHTSSGRWRKYAKNLGPMITALGIST